VAARLLIKSGEEADPADLPGVADMTADLLTKGTTTRTAEQIAREVEALGATLDSGAGWDNSFVAVSVMSSKLPAAMGYMADVVRNPTFKDEELERERQQALDAVRVALKQPRSLGQRMAALVVFGNTPYGHAGATIESAQKMKRDDLVAFHRRHYAPNNAILVIVGDITPAEAHKLAEENFGSWKAETAAATSAAATGSLPAPRVVVVDLPNAGQAVVYVSRPGLRRSDPQYALAQVMNSVLGGGYSSRLNEEIRVKRGLTYGAHSWFEFRRETGPFTAGAQTKNESAAEVAHLLVAEMAKMVAEPVPAEELTPRKATLIGGFARSLETNAGIAGRIGDLALYGINLNEIASYIPSVEAVTAAQIQEFAKEHLGPSSVVIVGDSKKMKLDDLKKEFPQVEIVPAATVK
ncbi:MAG TPA: pitrilysin family protein, partial [Thermoanaerobaculia bacterium]|nr:pitrilysin family protein [Thermoanaerobaculia bacterium]